MKYVIENICDNYSANKIWIHKHVCHTCTNKRLHQMHNVLIYLCSDRQGMKLVRGIFVMKNGFTSTCSGDIWHKTQLVRGIFVNKQQKT